MYGQVLCRGFVPRGEDIPNVAGAVGCQLRPRLPRDSPSSSRRGLEHVSSNIVQEKVKGLIRIEINFNTAGGQMTQRTPHVAT